MKTEPMPSVPLNVVRDDLTGYLRKAKRRPVVITKEGKPAGVLIGFADEDEFFDWKLEHDPRFLARIAKARDSARAGRVTTLDKVRREILGPEKE